MTHSFAGIIAFFIDDKWTLTQRMVDFKVMAKSDHQGAYAAISFVKSAASRGGLDKFIALAMDNASANDVMMQGVCILLESRYDITLDSANSQIRCFAHVLNLVVQACLHSLKEAEDPEIFDYYYKLHRRDPIHYDEDMADADAAAESLNEPGEEDSDAMIIDIDKGDDASSEVEEEISDLLRKLKVKGNRRDVRAGEGPFTKSALEKVGITFFCLVHFEIHIDDLYLDSADMHQGSELTTAA